MGKPKQFSITFNHPQCLYTPGDVVSGTVTLELQSEMKMRGVRLELQGQAVVRWEEGGGKRRRIYICTQTYFNEAIGLFGSRTESQVVQPGLYNYSFTFTLSRNLPASFRSLHGNIRYFAKAVVDIPFGFDHTNQMDFTVLPFLDLNLELPMLRQASLMQKHEKVSCCGASGLIEVDLVVNRLCFVPGETIFIRGTVKNNTNRDISATKAILLQNLQYHARTKSHTWTWNEIGSACRPGIEAGKSDSFDNLPIVIPPTPPSRLDGCTIIDIIYHLKFEVSMTCNNVVLDSEVTIGTVPLLGTNIPIMQQPHMLHMPMPMPMVPQQPGHMYPAVQPQQLPPPPMQYQQPPRQQQQPPMQQQQQQPTVSNKQAITTANNSPKKSGKKSSSSSSSDSDSDREKSKDRKKDRKKGDQDRNQPTIHRSGRVDPAQRSWNDV